MPNETVEARLVRAKQYLAIAKSPDPAAAARQDAALRASGMTDREIAGALDRSVSRIEELIA